MTQHHLRGQDDGTRVHLILTGILRGSAVGRLEHRHRIETIGPECDADTADLRGEHIRNVIAVKIQGSERCILRPQQYLLEERLGADVLDHDLASGLGLIRRCHGSFSIRVALSFRCANV